MTFKMKAVSLGKFKTTIEAPKGATKEQLNKKARKYIRGNYQLIMKP